MPLNDDPDALSDDDYEALMDEMAARAAERGEPPCRMAVPAGELAAALARLDDHDDYVNGEQ
jgi:hypothetical protein